MLRLPFDTKPRTVAAMTCFVLLCSLSGCHHGKKTTPVAVPEVVLATVQVHDVQQYLETDGYAGPFEFVEVPARVTGFLNQRRYTPGEIVKAGDPLFLIEQSRYQADVAAAEADLESAKAQLMLDEANLARTRELIKKEAVTEQDLQTDEAKRDEAIAGVKRAAADLDTARLNLSYTDVRSPVTGKVAENLVDVGNLVGPETEHTKLTTVAGMDPIYVYFDVSDYEFNYIRNLALGKNDPKVEKLTKQLDALKTKNRAPHSVSKGIDKIEESGIDPDKPEAAPWETIGLHGLIEVALLKGAAPNTREYPFQGIIDMTDNVIKRTTGTITVRGAVPNSNYAIYSGQSCYVRIPTEVVRNSLLVEEKAIMTDLNNRYVFVVDEKNIAQRRNITLGSLQPDGTRVVLKGLEKNERYVLVGGQKARDNKPVKPVEPKKLKKEAIQKDTPKKDASKKDETPKAAPKVDAPKPQPQDAKDRPETSE